MKKNINVIERGSTPYQTIMLLAWPIVVEQLMLTLVQYMDTAMVGSLGASATAAVSINTSVINLVNGLMLAFGVAFTTLVARAIGANDAERAKKVTSQALLCCVVAGTFCTIIMCGFSQSIPSFMGAGEDILKDANAYLFFISISMLFKSMTIIFGGICRGSGDTETPMRINVLVNIINVIGNFLLIFPTRTLTIFGISFTMFGGGFGVAGAAIATTLSVIVGGVLMGYAIFFKHKDISPLIGGKLNLKPDKEILSVAYKIGWPAAGERFALSFAQILVTMIIAGLGTVSLAAHHVAIIAESICYMPGFAFGTAATTLTGQALGAKREDLTNTLTLSSIKIGVGFMTVMGVVLFLSAEFLISLFTPDPAVIALGANCLRIVAFAQPFFGTAIVITGILRGAGDTKIPLVVVLISMWIMRISIAFVLVRFLGFGLEALWFCMFLDFFTRAALFSLRYKSGKWKHALSD